MSLIEHLEAIGNANNRKNYVPIAVKILQTSEAIEQFYLEYVKVIRDTSIRRKKGNPLNPRVIAYSNIMHILSGESGDVINLWESTITHLDERLDSLDGQITSIS